jgi:hypothetical protein
MIDLPEGELYLGEQIDPAGRERSGEAVLLEASDLTTHGVIVGMTGSGKTGLGVVMLEEALLAGIPTLIVDPKGDLGNLLLTFPGLRPEDFAPWVEDGDPAAVATQWRDGLAGWDIGPERIAALRAAAEFTIYTPGSTSGVPLNIVGSLRRPAEGTDAETVGDEVEGFVSGLLAMVGVDSDPLSGREHILVAHLIETAWAEGRDLDLPTLVAQVQDPPLRKLGVYELDAFFPPKDRTQLAMTLNGLLASRAFAAWAEGPDLDIDRLLTAADGTRPACSIVSLSHLSDEERQFVVSLLLGKLITWMRRQAGTSRLRALVYFDEVMGFVPPNGAPPAKKPILTLFKQARAFGVGIVLATQNPVDLDYKGLSNAGTWMIGRLQTEQDKARLLDGLTSAGGEVDVAAAGATISSLGKREFMLRAAGTSTPSLFTTRWALSYLRGPLTRDQIATLMTARKAELAAPGPAAPAADPAPPADSASPPPSTAEPASEAPTAPPTAPNRTAAAPTADDTLPVAPTVAEGVAVRWLDPAAPWAAQAGAVANGTRLAPALMARVSLLFDDDKLDLRSTEEWEAVYLPLAAQFDASAAIAVDHDDRDLRTESPSRATYALTDVPLGKKAWFTSAEKAIVDHLFRTHTTQVLRNPQLKLAARVGESADEFAARCRATAEEEADEARTALRKKFEARIAKARDQHQAALDRLAQAQEVESSRKQSTLVKGAGSLLSAVLGGKRNARRMASDVESMLGSQGRSGEAARRVDTARNQAQRRHDVVADLEDQLAAELRDLDDDAATRAAAVETVEVPLERSDIRVTALSLVWVPTA